MVLLQIHGFNTLMMNVINRKRRLRSCREGENKVVTSDFYDDLGHMQQFCGADWRRGRVVDFGPVQGSILSRGAFRCGLEQDTFPQLLK